MPDSPEHPYRAPAFVTPRTPSRRLEKATYILMLVAILIVPVNFIVFVKIYFTGAWLFELLAIGQLVAGAGALVCGFLCAKRAGASRGERLLFRILGAVGFVVGLGGPLALWFLKLGEGIDFSGGAWGRPLRVRGRTLHPQLREGSDWTRGDRPNADGLDEPTRAALEALWLHDAQKEHASVPAFARISWLLAAVGAPAELVEGAHRAALEEIDHARRCFALAAGYGGRSHSAQPMPDLLVGGLDLGGDPLVLLATESLTDGCLLEDFNADVAAACEQSCEDPAVKNVLARIAKEERSHAAFSWALLAWVVERGGDRITRAVAKAADGLDRVPRPTAVSAKNARLVDRADLRGMARHGRIADATWASLWSERVVATRQHAAALLARSPAAWRHAS